MLLNKRLNKLSLKSLRMLSAELFLCELKSSVLKRGLRVLPDMSSGTEEKDCIYDGGMTSLECSMEVLGLVPASEHKWYRLTSRVSLVSTLKLMEEMFELAKELEIL